MGGQEWRYFYQDIIFEHNRAWKAVNSRVYMHPQGHEKANFWREAESYQRIHCPQYGFVPIGHKRSRRLDGHLLGTVPLIESPV